MIKTIGNKIITSLPLSFYQSLFKRKVIGLEYHLASDEALPYVEHLFKYKSVDLLEKDLIYLKKTHNIISYDQLCNSENIKPNSIILTFDDGYKELYSKVLPLLIKHDLPAIFFIITSIIDNKNIFYRNGVSLCIDKLLKHDSQEKICQSINSNFNIELNNSTEFISWIKQFEYSDLDKLEFVYQLLEIEVKDFLQNQQPYLTTNEIKHLARNGITIGGHSLYHQELFKLNDHQEIEAQIVESCKIIQSITQAQNVPFSFPYTSIGIDKKLIEDILTRHSFIPFVFGESGFKQAPSYFIHRINGDSLNFHNKQNSNLNALLKREYESHLKHVMTSSG